MKHINYSGEFVSLSGVVWRVDILTDTPVHTVGELTFGGDPLEIAWSDTSKHEPICPSSATLTLISPGDRSYIGLYTEDATGVRMDVYRGDSLYWRGFLDPEFYEEPYTSDQGYDVTLTFTDFGVLSRCNYEGYGRRQVLELIRMIFSRLDFDDIDMSLMSGSINRFDDEFLEWLHVESGNFYDEDGEAMNLSDVLGAVLQPLALRVVQRAGKVWVYDLNGLYFSPKISIDWQSDNQVLGTDRVYNNVRITWSPYTQEVISYAHAWENTKEIPRSVWRNALGSLEPVVYEGVQVYAYHESNIPGSWRDDTIGFAMLLSDNGRGATLSGAKFCKMIPYASGEEIEGVAITWPAAGVQGGGITFIRVGESPIYGYDSGSVGNPIIAYPPLEIPLVIDSEYFYLQISMRAMVDPRYNPFDKTDEYNENFGDYNLFVNWEQFRKRANFVYVPVRVRYISPSGKTYYWSNRNSVTDKSPSWYLRGGFWSEEEDFGYFAWYNPSARDTESAINWEPNRAAINPSSVAHLSDSLSNFEGQKIYYPPESGGGTMYIEVCRSPWIVRDVPYLQNPDTKYPSYSKDRRVTSPPNTEDVETANSVKWIVLGWPDIHICGEGPYTNLPKDDVEYAAVLNASAKEDLEIDTICGTPKFDIPLARGAYYSMYESAYNQITRAGITDQAEKLLIGTLYSQYANRKTKLSGTAAMSGEGVCTYVDASHTGTFMLTGAVEKLREDIVDGTFVEVSPDEYTSKA